MGVHKFTQEIKCKVPSKRMFKAFVTETYDTLPKIIPHSVKSVEILQGDGGAGMIRKTNFAEGLPFSHAIYKFDLLDAENHATKFTLVEGGVIGDQIESLFYDLKCEDTPDGGCIVKVVREWRTKGDAELKDEIVKAEEEGYVAASKQVEEYLLAHPQVCA